MILVRYDNPQLRTQTSYCFRSCTTLPFSKPPSQKIVLNLQQEELGSDRNTDFLNGRICRLDPQLGNQHAVPCENTPEGWKDRLHSHLDHRGPGSNLGTKGRPKMLRLCGAGCLGSGWGPWWAFLASGGPGLPAWVSSAPEAQSAGGNRALHCCSCVPASA